MSGPPWAALGAFIKEIGFPIFVAVYLLVQVVALAPKVETIARSLEEMQRSLARIEWTIRGGR